MDKYSKGDGKKESVMAKENWQKVTMLFKVFGKMINLSKSYERYKHAKEWYSWLYNYNQQCKN